MEHGLKDIAFLCTKHIAVRVVLSKLPTGSRQAAWWRPYLWDWSIDWCRNLRGRHHGTRLWNNVDVKWLWRILQSSGRHEHDAEHDAHSWLSSRVTLNQRCFAFIRPRTPLVYRYIVISRSQSHSAVFGCSPSGWVEQYPPRVCCLTVEQLLNCLDWIWTGWAAEIDAKTKFRFGNIVPNQWTMSVFVQHTSANSMYKDDNKISQQQKVLHMNKMLERVTHFQTSFSVGIQPLS